MILMNEYKQLLKLYALKMLKVFELVAVHTEEVVAYTQQQQDRLSHEIELLMEDLQLFDDMIEQLKETIKENKENQPK